MSLTRPGSPSSASATAASCRCTATACWATWSRQKTRCRRRCCGRGRAGPRSTAVLAHGPGCTASSPRRASTSCARRERRARRARRRVDRGRALAAAMPRRAARRGREPEGAAIRRETVELAYLAVIQLLPARQRAVLLLRDVQGYSAAETASILDLSVAAVTSALQRARATIAGAGGGQGRGLVAERDHRGRPGAADGVHRGARAPGPGRGPGGDPRGHPGRDAAQPWPVHRQGRDRRAHGPRVRPLDLRRLEAPADRGQPHAGRGVVPAPRGQRPSTSRSSWTCCAPAAA